MGGLECKFKGKTKRIPFGIRFVLAPQVGLEPTTLRLTAACSTDWAKEEYLKSDCKDFLCWNLTFKFWQRLTFPGSHPPSIISAKELNYCVRNGNRCDLLAIATRWTWRSILYHAFAFLKDFISLRRCFCIIRYYPLFAWRLTHRFRHIYIKPLGLTSVCVLETEREISEEAWRFTQSTLSHFLWVFFHAANVYLSSRLHLHKLISH